MSQNANAEVLVVNDLGLHLRAAGLLVQEASRFTSEIWLQGGAGQANAKSIMSVLGLAAAKGTTLRLTAQGADAEAAVAAVVKLFAGGFAKP